MRNWKPFGLLSLLLVLIFGLITQSLFLGVALSVIAVSASLSMYWFAQITADQLIAAVYSFGASNYGDGMWKLFFAVVFLAAIALTFMFAIGLALVIV